MLYGLGDFLALWANDQDPDYPFSKTMWGVLSIFIDRRFIDIWFPNSTSSKLRNIEHLFEEMDKDNDKIIMPNEVDSDLK